MIKQAARKVLFRLLIRRRGEASWELLPTWYIRWRLARHLGAWNIAPRQRLRREIAAVGGSVLEVASGPGIEYYGLRRDNVAVDYTGVDITPRMLALAKRRFPEAKFVLGSVDQLPFPDNQFDTVFAKDLFEHLPGFERGLSEMYRVARRSVLVYFFLPLVDGETTYEKDALTGFRQNRYSRPGVEAFTRQLGADSVEIITIDGDGSRGTLLKVQKGLAPVATGDSTMPTTTAG